MNDLETYIKLFIVALFLFGMLGIGLIVLEIWDEKKK